MLGCHQLLGVVKIPDLPHLLSKPIRDDRVFAKETCNYQEIQGRKRGRLERFNIVFAILLAGWVPSILMLVVSYTILTNTLESKILRDRQTFVQLIAHLVGEDLANTRRRSSTTKRSPTSRRTSPAPTRSHRAAVAQSAPSIRIRGLTACSLLTQEGRLISAMPSSPRDDRAGFLFATLARGSRSPPQVFTYRRFTHGPRTSAWSPTSWEQSATPMGTWSVIWASPSWWNGWETPVLDRVCRSIDLPGSRSDTAPLFSRTTSRQRPAPFLAEGESLIKEIR